MTSTNDQNTEFRDAGFDPTELDSVQTGRNLVMVIGIDDYQHWRKLSNAVSDARGIRKLFVETFGFGEPAPPLYDDAASKEAITGLVEDQLRNELQPDDALTLFFAGHGHTRVDKVGDREIETGFIVPAEARRDQWGDYIKMNDWLEAISTLPARHILVILDACHSGFGVGQAMKIYRDAVHYEQDLTGRLSRKVFTSARRDQRALDGGPIEGHSLFTGTLIDGLNWGKADLDSNGLITGSELGLYVQQQVGQHSQSRQTPDFGAFDLDDRGDLVISLRDNSFDALKAQAFAAFGRAEMDRFAELVSQVAQLRPDSPEALYLQYRLAFYQDDVLLAGSLAEQLYDMEFKQGVIPLSKDALWEIKVQIPYWQNVLSIGSAHSPLVIELMTGKKGEAVRSVPIQTVGQIEGYRCELGMRFQFRIKNSAEHPVYVYMIQIETTGHIEFVTPWREITTPVGSQERRLTYPFKNGGEPGLFEIRFYTSPTQIPELLSPPSIAPPSLSFGLGYLDEDNDELNPLSAAELSEMRMQTINFFSVPAMGR